MNEQVSLTRAAILAGMTEAILTRDAPDLRVATEAEQKASLREFLADRKPGPVWLFGYGSLIWNPAVQFVDHRTALVKGWHRSFSLSVEAGRGSPANPGLVLALEPGGSCQGVGFLLEDEGLDLELSALWRREMLTGAYEPHWVKLIGMNGKTFGQAIAFAINPDSPQYAGNLTEAQVVARLSTAKGALGSAAEYLFQTCEGLRSYGIPDTDIERLSQLVAAAQENEPLPIHQASEISG